MSTPPGTAKPAISRVPIPLLVAIAAISPLAINIYLPSTPGMARALGVDYATIQLTLSLYYAALAIGQLIVGPLSDRFGRRPVLLFGLGIFVAGSAMCFLASDIGILILGRILQAAGGCTGITISRAIVRDVYARDKVASAIGYVTMGMAVAPMVSPTIGGLLDSVYGWRASFGFLAIFGCIILSFAFWRLSETNARRGRAESPQQFWRNNVLLLRSRLFWGYALTTGLVSSIFFAFLAGAPYVMIELLGRSPIEYGLYFPLAAGGYIVGNFMTGKLVSRIGLNPMILAGIILSICSVAAMAAFLAAGLTHPAALFGPMFFLGIGSGLVVPNGVAGAVNVRPEVAGAASGLAGSVQMGSGVITTFVVGSILHATVWPLVAVMAISAVLSLAAFALVAAGSGSSE